jgi:hypothetical protein
MECLQKDGVIVTTEEASSPKQKNFFRDHEWKEMEEQRGTKKRKIQNLDSTELSSSFEFSSPERISINAVILNEKKIRVGKFVYAKSGYSSRDPLTWIGKVILIYKSQENYELELNWFFRSNQMNSLKLEFLHEVVQTNRTEIVPSRSIFGTCKVRSFKSKEIFISRSFSEAKWIPLSHLMGRCQISTFDDPPNIGM